MSRLLRIPSVTVMLAVVLAPVLRAQSTADLPPAAPPVSQVRPPITPADTLLPLGFRGMTPWDLAAQLRSVQPRDEYESTAAYLARLGASLGNRMTALSLEMAANPSAANPSAAGRPQGVLAEVPVQHRYDADEAALVLTFRRASVPEDMEANASGGSGILLGRRVIRRARVQGRMVEWTERYILAAGPQPRVGDEDASSGDTMRLLWRLPLPPDSARTVRSHLRVVLLVAPTADQAGRLVEPHAPTMASAPIQARDTAVLERAEVVLASRAVALLVDDRTGRVLGRHEILDAPPGMANRDGAGLVAWSASETPAGSTHAIPADAPYFEFQVEKPAVPAPGNHGPTFPPLLKTQRVEGEVLAQFVVDPTGRVEMSTFKVLKASHELFIAAVRESLQDARYIPAEVGGRRVRQLIQQPFQFALP